MSISRFGAALRAASVLFSVLTLAWIASALATGSAGLHLITARAAHTATAQLDGSLLIAGGTTDKGPTRAVEVFDLVSGKSTAGPQLFEARSEHSATALADGRVLFAGGRNADGLSLASTEIYDTATGTLALGASMTVPRAGHTATMMADGRILIAGGDAFGVAEIYDPQTDRFSTVGRLVVPRSGHSAIRLATGQVLLVGGHGAAGATAEIFDPGSGTFTPVRGGLKAARVQPTLKLVSDGKVQVYGGDDEITMEVYNPVGYFSSRGHLMRDGSMFRSVLNSPGHAALIGIPAARGRHYAEEALGTAANEFERSNYTATEVAARSSLVIVGGRGISGNTLGSIDAIASCSGTVTTDLTDYYPGQTVVMSGSGWLPGELITLNLHRDTNDPPDTELYATADENGDWINAEYVVQDYDLNVTFVLTATGDSGCTAQTTFTDSPGPSTIKVVASGDPAISVTLSYAKTTGGCASGTSSTTTMTNTTGLVDSSFGPSVKYLLSVPATLSGVDVPTGATFQNWALPGGGTSTTNPLCVSGSNTNPPATLTYTAVYAVSIATTTTVLASSLSPSTYGQNVTFTATVMAGANPVTAGSVTFIEGGTCAAPTATLAGPTAVVGGLAAFSTSNLAAGSHTLTACYGGAASFAASSGNLTQDVNKADATIDVTPYHVTYDASAHTATGTATGVGGVDLSADLDLAGTTHTNAGSYTDAWTFHDPDGNYNDAGANITDIIDKADATIDVTPYHVTYDATAHTATGTATGVGGVDLSADLNLAGTTHTNAGSYTDAWTFHDPDGNYNDAGANITDIIDKADATIDVTPYHVTYDASAHTATGTATGVGGIDLSADLDLTGTTHTNAGSYTDAWTFHDPDGNYNDAGANITDIIDKADATIDVTPYHVMYDALPHTATGTATGVSDETLAGLDLSGTTHTNAGTYNDTWTFTDVTGNYNNASGQITDVIDPRPALVRYIGQQTFVTSGTSSTTAQVNLSASVQDPTGLALVGAKIDFIDTSTGKVMAGGITVTPVFGSPANTGTANAIVTLSTGQFGAQSYEILVRMTGDYTNADQDVNDKTASVVVAKPAATNETTGGGTFAPLSTAAGILAGGSTPHYCVGMSYTNKGTNVKGQIMLVLPHADGLVYVKSNSISSMAVGSGASTIYTKASVFEVLGDGSTVTIDGNVTLRMDAQSASPGMVGFTVLSSKDSTLYYSNNWVISGNAWRTQVENIDPGSMIMIH